jgi:hypothetical protein
MPHARSIGLAATLWAMIAAAPAVSQKSSDGVNGKHACALFSLAEIKKLADGKDVARSPGKAEERPFTSDCLYYGAFDISIHIGNETRVMFGRVRDNYAKAPAKLGYKVEPLSGLGDDAYYLTYSGKAEARAMVGEIELAISLSGSLPPDEEAKTIALNIAKAAAAKLK